MTSFDAAPILLCMLTLAQIISVVTGGTCDDHCDKYRPVGTNGAYTLDCRQISGNKTECGVMCANCSKICYGGHTTVPELHHNTFNCGAKSANSAKARNFDEDFDKRRDEFDRRHDQFERERDTTITSFFILYAVIIVVVLLCCIGIPACIFCANQANRYPHVPIMHAAPTVYPAQTYAAVPMMMGGSTVVTYSNQTNVAPATAPPPRTATGAEAETA